jgi:hypothetical protein
MRYKALYEAERRQSDELKMRLETLKEKIATIRKKWETGDTDEYKYGVILGLELAEEVLEKEKK